MYKYKVSITIKSLEYLKQNMVKLLTILDSYILKSRTNQTEYIGKEVTKLITKVDTKTSVFCVYKDTNNVKLLTQLIWDKDYKNSYYIDLKSNKHLNDEEFITYKDNHNYTDIEGIFDNVPENMIVAEQDYEDYIWSKV